MPMLITFPTSGSTIDSQNRAILQELVDVEKDYSTERLRPHYRSFEMRPLFIMTSD